MLNNVAHGQALTDSVGVSVEDPDISPTGDALTVINNLTRDLNLINHRRSSHRITGGSNFLAAQFKTIGHDAFHYVYGELERGDAPIPLAAIIVVEERAGTVASVKISYRK